MPSPLITASLISAGGGLLGGLFGGDDDEFKMSPEQRAIYNRLLKEYESGEFGFNQAEKNAMLDNIRRSLTGEKQRVIGSSSASLARRGVNDPGQQAGLRADVGSAFGKAIGESRTGIELASAQEKRRRKSELESALLGSSRGQFVGGDNSMFDDLGGLSENLMSYFLLRGNKPDDDEGFFSNLRAPGLR